MENWWIVNDNCLRYFDIQNVFSLRSMELARFTYVEGDTRRDFDVRLQLDTFRNISYDCFNMYLDEDIEKAEVWKPFLFRIWIEGRDKKRYFTSRVSVEKSHLCVWSVRRHILLEQYDFLKTVKNESTNMTFAFKFGPVSDSSLESTQESDAAKTHIGIRLPEKVFAIEQGIEYVKSFCRGLLADKKRGRPDLELQCEKDIFPLIKTDLQHRCETFAEDMLSRSSIRNRVKVTDMESGVLAVLLMNICFEKVTKFPSDLAPEVFHFSIKYKLPNLVARSISIMARHLGEKEIEYLLPFAITCGEDFMPEIISTMKIPEEFFKSKAWSNFASKHKAWACEAYLPYFAKCLKKIEG